MIPGDLRYVATHEWVRIEGNLARVGITHFAQHQLGDIVYVQLPEAGKSFQKGEVFGSVESVKTSADLYAPLSGVVEEVNKNLKDAPELVNKDPYGEGWMIVLKITNEEEVQTLLDAQAYLALPDITPEYRASIGK
ncbi:MAG: glycine cleavage system protein GcvH [bacterium JZ-2024 1]